MYKYKLLKRNNPKAPDAPKKWYAAPLSEAAQDVKSMTRAATENTTVAPKEMETSLELLGNYARKQLLQGHVVRVGDLGTLRITFQSEGVEDIVKYNASAMIKNPRILFTPSKEFRDTIVKNLQFENGGVLDGDINYASLADYKKAKGITDSTPDPEPGGDSGDEGGSPL
ncbi:hypothetical protein HF895_02260 [Bacteroides sp. AN502]|nr:hypothetical protein [Caecibacteroides pullorum]MDC6279418.1 hypothetical protein [Caecibacteroides pullorum]